MTPINSLKPLISQTRGDGEKTCTPCKVHLRRAGLRAIDDVHGLNRDTVCEDSESVQRIGQEIARVYRCRGGPRSPLVTEEHMRRRSVIKWGSGLLSSRILRIARVAMLL